MNIFTQFYSHAKDVKTAKRSMDKCLERLESALSKLIAFPKTVDSLTFAEQTDLVVEARKSYQTVTFDFVHKVSLLKAYVDSIFAEKMFTSLDSISALFEESNLIITSLKAGAKNYQTQTLPAIDVLNYNHKHWLESVHSSSLGRKSSMGNKKLLPELPGELLGVGAPSDLEGYLFRKIDQRWSRRFFILKEGSLTYSNSSKPNSLSEFTTINIAMCVPKFTFTEDRKNVFELNILRSESLILQAETEQDMILWMDSIDLAKKFLADESLKEGKDILSPLSASSKQDPSNSSDQELQISVTVDESASVGPESFSLLECTIEYGDPQLEKKNVELHRLFKSVPERDFVIEGIRILLNYSFPRRTSKRYPSSRKVLPYPKQNLLLFQHNRVCQYRSNTHVRYQRFDNEAWCFTHFHHCFVKL
jgi:PH domain